MKKYNQYETIYYSKLLKCKCDYADYMYKHTFNVIGYCETPNGYMAVFECKKCFEKYRHHIGYEYNFENFYKKLINIKNEK